MNPVWESKTEATLMLGCDHNRPDRERLPVAMTKLNTDMMQCYWDVLCVHTSVTRWHKDSGGAD